MRNDRNDQKPSWIDRVHLPFLRGIENVTMQDFNLPFSYRDDCKVLKKKCEWMHYGTYKKIKSKGEGITRTEKDQPRA